MTHSVETQSQIVFNSIYHQQNFMNDPKYGGTTEPGVYLSRLISQNLNALVDESGNCVVSGLKVSVTPVGPNVELEIHPGLAIADITLLELENATNLDFDTSTDLSKDLLVAVLTYEHGNQTVENNFSIKLYLVDSTTGASYNPQGNTWNHDDHKVILAVLKLTRDGGNNVTNVEDVRFDFPGRDIKFYKSYLIEGQNYEFKTPPLNENFRRKLEQIVSNNHIFWFLDIPMYKPEDPNLIYHVLELFE